jgi:hypothetical protein
MRAKLSTGARELEQERKDSESMTKSEGTRVGVRSKVRVGCDGQEREDKIVKESESEKKRGSRKREYAFERRR